MSPRYFFFFQAEDGIRDLTVTGVQTCALPIFPPTPVRPARRRGAAVPALARPRRVHGPRRLGAQIGRASCRERSVDLGGRRIIKKKKKQYSGRSMLYQQSNNIDYSITGVLQSI